MYRIDKTVKDRKQMSSCRGNGIGESECLIGTEFPLGMMKMFWN